MASQGKLAAALPFAERAYKAFTADKNLDLKMAHVYVNCLLDMSKTERVLEIMPHLLELFPEDRAILVSKASALRSVGKRQEALDLLDQLIEKYPEEPVVRRIKADTLGDKNPLDALPDYEKALEYR